MTTADVAQTDLESTRVASRTYVSRRRTSRFDASTFLCVMVALATLIPARYIVPGMTDLGRPGLIVGFLLLFWWLATRVAPHLAQPGPQPIRWALLGYAVSMLASYAAGMLRPLTSAEANSADRAVLGVCVFAGAALAAADGIRTWERLDRLLTVLIVCGSVMAFIAVVQFVTRVDLTQYMVIPGLQQKHEVIVFEDRGATIRVASTTSHYIELATVLMIILPFAIHRALFGETQRRRRWGIVAAVLLAGGMFATVSRTGVLALVIVVVMLLPHWTWRLRYNVFVVAAMFGAVLTVLKPSLVLTLTGLFDDPSTNPAFTVRQSRYPMVWAFVSERPWFGRGTGTYVFPQYQFLDNEWLGHLISNGITGVLAFAAMHIIGIVIALKAARRATTRALRHLCTGVASTQVVAAVTAVTFDSMSFLTHVLMVALTLGLCGTVWRLTHPRAEVRTGAPRVFASDPAAAARLRHHIPR